MKKSFKIKFDRRAILIYDAIFNRFDIYNANSTRGLERRERILFRQKMCFSRSRGKTVYFHPSVYKSKNQFSLENRIFIAASEHTIFFANNAMYTVVHIRKVKKQY